MKLGHFSPAVFVTLLIVFPAVLRADTIYYRPADAASIKSVSGTIVKEANGLLEIATTDGKTIKIPRSDVFQIVRGGPSAPQAPAASNASSASSAPQAPAASNASSVPEPGQASRSPYSREAPAVEQSFDEIQMPAGFSAAPAVARRSNFDQPLSNPSHYHYGLKGGLSKSNLRTDPQALEDSGSLTGYAFGFWWGVPLARYLSIQTEALFSMKGDSETAGGYTASTRLSYFDLPVLAKVGLFNDARVQPSFFVGPSLGFNASAHSGLEGDGGEVDMDVKDQVGTVDFGLVLGGGLDFRAGRRTFGVDVRYSKGLSNIAESAEGTAHNESIVVMGSIGLK